MAQPIIRGIQAVGSVSIKYRYNSTGNTLPIPEGVMTGFPASAAIKTGTDGVEVSGFRLDGEFMRAAQQIASSATIPLLGGGGFTLTNNNRTGTLAITCTRVSTPTLDADKAASMYSPAGGGVGVTSATGGTTPEVYDLSLLAQIQQAAPGGDSVGANLIISFNFNGRGTKVTFESCTVAEVAPLALSGSDAANYNVVFNYLNWKVEYLSSAIA